MTNWIYLLVAAALLLVFLLYNEWKRKNKSRLFGRLAASLLAVVSLIFMAYPYAEKKDNLAIKTIVLLTDGYIKDSVAHFLQQTNKHIPVFAAAVQQNIFAGNSVQLVTDWSAFSTKHADDTLHVFGNGLSAEALALISPHPIVFYAPAVMPGISHIYWNQNVQSGAQLNVQGHYENTSSQKIKIVLQAFGAGRDTAFIDAFTSQDFMLHTIPLHTGSAVYSLIVTAGKDTLEKEPVPVNVETATTLQLLIISSSPDFENTFLKNHLSQQGYQITTITSISNNKTNKQFLNTPEQEVNRLTVSYLNRFDVLMADEQALQKISTTELSAIRSVVEDKGTGLLIKIDSQKNAAAFYSRFFPVKKMQQEKRSFLLLRGGVADSNQYKIKIDDPVSILYTPGTQIVLQDQQSNVYAAAVVYGNGKIVATTLQNIYSIALAGDKASYQQLWWLLLNKAAKKVYPATSWLKTPFISFVNNAVQLQAENNDTGMPETVLNETNIYLKQNAFLPFQWQGKYWPATDGWQLWPQLKTETGRWYVNKTGDWKPLITYDHLTGTKKYALMHPVLFGQALNKQADRFFIHWPLLLLIVFLTSCIFLWVEQKAG